MPMAGGSEDDSGLMLPTASGLQPAVGTLTSKSRRPITIHGLSRFRPADGAYNDGEDDECTGDEDDSLSISDMDSGHDSSDQVLGESNRDKEANY